MLAAASHPGRADSLDAIDHLGRITPASGRCSPASGTATGVPSNISTSPSSEGAAGTSSSEDEDET